jgi:hypothetical protein
MSIIDKLVSRRVGELLIQKKFKEDTFWKRRENGTLVNVQYDRTGYPLNIDLYETLLPAPTLSLVQTWLRDSCNVIVTITYSTITKKYSSIIYHNASIVEHAGTANYEYTLELGIEKALSLI